MFELMDSYSQTAVIKLIGIGGGGGNAVDHMVRSSIEGVEFVCANTDAQALKSVSAKTTLQMGASMTKGLGAGANPEIGRQAALEDRERIQELIAGTDMLFIAAGMGGGTGTGAAPVIAQLAREMGVLTVAVVTKPFPFEGSKRMKVATDGIDQLSQHVDSLITIPNEKLLTVLGKEVTVLDAFRSANEVLQGAVQGIAELITRPGLINVDFADVKTVMSEMGMAMMGTGVASGDERARRAAEAAINSPLLEDQMERSRWQPAPLPAPEGQQDTDPAHEIAEMAMTEIGGISETSQGSSVSDSAIRHATPPPPPIAQTLVGQYKNAGRLNTDELSISINLAVIIAAACLVVGGLVGFMIGQFI